MRSGPVRSSKVACRKGCALADKSAMVDGSSTIILHNGGLRSMVATAAILSRSKPHLVHLIHVRDSRPNAPTRLDHVRRQADHFEIRQIHILDLPQPPAGPDPNVRLESVTAPLYRPLVLLLGLSCASELQAGRLVWPCQFNADFDQCARATEQSVLAQSLARLERDALPSIETPLLELEDQQIIELGGHMDVPWQLAWSCLLRGETPCRACDACRRRQAAWDAAGMVEPTGRPLVTN